MHVVDAFPVHPIIATTRMTSTKQSEKSSNHRMPMHWMEPIAWNWKQSIIEVFRNILFRSSTRETVNCGGRLCIFQLNRKTKWAQQQRSYNAYAMEVCEKLLFNRMSLLQSRWKLFGLETRKHLFFSHRCQSIPFMYIYSRLYDIFSIHIRWAKTRTNTINRIHIAVLMWFNSI